MATMNFTRTQSFKGYGTRTQWALVVPKAGVDNACEVAGDGATNVLGSLFNVNTVDGEPVGVVTEKGAKVVGIASAAIAAGALLGAAANGQVKTVTTGGLFVALTAATAAGQYVEMVTI